jgi:ribosome-binding protein aMBF1 (putative translation factor)
MNALTNIQTINDQDGKPAFVVLPYDEFVRAFPLAANTIPNEVMARVVKDGMTPIKAWREHIGLTQAQVAHRMGISQAAFAQMEAPSARPRKAPVRKVAQALGITIEQLAF